MNFKRSYLIYASGDRYVTYVPADEAYNQTAPQSGAFYTIGTEDIPNSVFDTDADAFAYFDSVIPAAMVANHNTATGQSQTVGVVAAFNADTVRNEFSRVDGDLAAALVRISDLEDTVLTLEARVSALEV